MMQLIELHRQHPVYDWTDTFKVKKQIENKAAAVENLLLLENGISTIIENPVFNNPPTRPFWYKKKHLEQATKEVWELLKSSALKKELQRYIDHIK